VESEPLRLTRRELEVAELVGQGLTNREIARRLVLSERTAQNHVQHILTKLGLANRSQVAVWVNSRKLSMPAE
jgi:DNA-binding NarL/FixJ family response regulator